MLRLLLLFFLTATIASAQETMIRQVYDAKTDTHVEVLALFTRPSADGYFPVRVKIANNLKSDRTIQLNFECSGGYVSNVNANSAYAFTAPAEKTVTRDILVPLSPTAENYGSNVNVKVMLTGSLGEGENSISAAYDSDQPSVLLSEALFTPNASLLDSEAATHFSGRRYGGGDFTAKFDPKQLPDDWLAFSGYDSVLMLDSDWTNMPPGSRNAILSWVRLGGQLVIYTSSSATAATLGMPAESSFGTITFKSIASSRSLPAAATLDLVTSGARHKPRKVSLTSDFSHAWPLQDAFGEKPFRYVIFIIVLIAFGILVGPVNLFVFAKSGRRHRLFITTPLISLGASLLLIALIIFQDGFGGSGRRIVLMEVRPDGDQNAAFVQQEQISRTGVLTRSSFTLSTPALFSPVPIAESRWARYTTSGSAKGSFNLQPAGGKIDASGDWFQSRSEHGHALSAVIPTRGRIEFSGSPQRLVSTFDFPIRTLYFLAADRTWSRADNIETGKSFTLEPVEFSMIDPELTEIRNSFSERNIENFTAVRERPGHFIAITDAAPGIDTNPGIRWEKTRTVITGPVVNP